MILNRGYMIVRPCLGGASSDSIFAGLAEADGGPFAYGGGHATLEDASAHKLPLAP